MKRDESVCFFLFSVLPPMLVSAIGHEMIHLSQYKRKTKIYLMGINNAVSAFRELEASNWEIGKRDFQWEIGWNKVFNCLLKEEEDEIKRTLEYREWEVRKRIEDLREGPYSDKNLKTLELWLKENPWTNKVWLPKNPNWKSYKAGTKPG